MEEKFKTSRYVSNVEFFILNDCGENNNTTYQEVAIFELMLFVPVNNFSVMSGRLPGLNQF